MANTDSCALHVLSQRNTNMTNAQASVGKRAMVICTNGLRAERFGDVAIGSMEKPNTKEDSRCRKEK